jgi:hypothetical protein
MTCQETLRLNVRYHYRGPLSPLMHVGRRICNQLLRQSTSSHTPTDAAVRAIYMCDVIIRTLLTRGPLLLLQTCTRLRDVAIMRGQTSSRLQLAAAVGHILPFRNCLSGFLRHGMGSTCLFIVRVNQIPPVAYANKDGTTLGHNMSSELVDTTTPRKSRLGPGTSQTTGKEDSASRDT